MRNYPEWIFFIGVVAAGDGNRAGEQLEQAR